MDPITALIASFAVQAVGSVAQGQGNSEAYAYKAAIDRQNAQIAEQQGIAALAQQQRNVYKTQGSIVAAYGASGVQSDNGSAADILADSAGQAALDRLTLKYNYDLKKNSYLQQAVLDQMGADTSSTAGMLNAASYGLKAYATYSKYSGGNIIPDFG